MVKDCYKNFINRTVQMGYNLVFEIKIPTNQLMLWSKSNLVTMQGLALVTFRDFSIVVETKGR